MIVDRFIETWRGVLIEYDRIGSGRTVNTWAYKYIISYPSRSFDRSGTIVGLGEARKRVHISIDNELDAGVAIRSKMLEDGTYEETVK